MPAETKTKIKTYLEDQFFSNNGESLQDDTPLLSSGIIDSISALQLVEFLEGEFGFQFEAHEVDQDNLNTLDTITEFVQGKVAQ